MFSVSVLMFPFQFLITRSTIVCNLTKKRKHLFSGVMSGISILYIFIGADLRDVSAIYLLIKLSLMWLSRGGSSPSDWVCRVSCLVQILGEKNLNSKQPSGGSLKTFVIALILIFQVASQKPAVFFFTDVYKKFRDICEEEHCRLLDSNLKY